MLLSPQFFRSLTVGTFRFLDFTVNSTVQKSLLTIVISLNTRVSGLLVEDDATSKRCAVKMYVLDGIGYLGESGSRKKTDKFSKKTHFIFLFKFFI